MTRKSTLVATAFSLAIAAFVASPARAEHPCQEQIKELQPKWDRMGPMPMDADYDGVKTAFRRGKELCQQGRSADASGYLDLVRSHLQAKADTHTHQNP